VAQWHKHRFHEDHRRRGNYDIIPGLAGDFNFTKHPPSIIPEELHMHKTQTDYFVVAAGKVLFRLVYEDGREEKLIISENDKKTLTVPPGVWHGYMALEPALMVFYITHKYDSSDEFRKKCDPSEWQL